MKKVLLVEDDDAIREMMRRRLVMRGFEVRVATEGAEAVTSALENRPEAILLDVQLPGAMSGWDVARALRADARTAGIRILLVTAHVTPADVERAGRIGCARFFSKPVDFRGIVEALGGAPERAVSR
jgi:two-component system, cell cycle response regulator DivK